MERHVVTTISEVKALVKKHWGEPFAADVETTGLAYRRDELVGVALYFKSDIAYYIVVKHTQGTMTEHQIKEYLPVKILAPILGPLFRQDVLMVCHNAKFDLHFLERHDMMPQGKLADTLLAAQLLDENRSNGLKDLAANLLHMPYAKYHTLLFYKGFKSVEILGGKLDEVAEYAMNDVEATWKLWQIFHTQLATEYHRDKNLLDVFNNIWMPLLVVLQQMEQVGIAMDMPLVHEMREEYVTIRDASEKIVKAAGIKMILDTWSPADIPKVYLRMATESELEDAYEDLEGNLVTDIDNVQVPIITHDMVGRTKTFKPRVCEFNTASSQQVATLIFDYAKVTVPQGVRLKTSDKTGEISADKDNLETIIFYNGENTPDYVKELLTFRKAEKFIGTYLDRFISDGDPDDHWAIHTWFAMAVADNGSGGTATGRLSSSQPNLQNIPSRGEVGKKARRLFVSRPGKSLVCADLSQAELRMMAHYSGDPILIDAFANSRDLHIVTGAGLGKIAYEELEELLANEDPRGTELRMLGKTANFALTYGMGARKFQRFILVNNKYEISIKEAQELIDLYNETYAAVQVWKERVIKLAHKLGYVTTIYGRKRRLPNLSSRDRQKRSYAERQAINAIVQGSVGDVICEAMVRIQPALMEIGGSILLQVHDELVAEIPDERVEEAKQLIEMLMVSHCNTILRIPQRCEAGVGKTWGDAKH